MRGNGKMQNKTTLQLLNGIINGVAILCTKTETQMDESETEKIKQIIDEYKAEIIRRTEAKSE